MLSKIKELVSSPADLIAVYLFTVYHYVRFNVGWPARKFYLTVVFLIAMVWELILLIRKCRSICFRTDAVSLISVALGVSIVLTAVFSKYGYRAYDPNNSEEGAVIWCVYLAVFLLFRREYVPKKSHLTLFLISGYVECLLIIINACVHNLFGRNASLYGNLNIVGQAMSVFYTVNLMMLADEDDRSMCLIHYILAFFFTLGLILSRSDNTLLCMATLLGVLPFLRTVTVDLLKKLIKLAALLLFSFAVMHFAVRLPVFQSNSSLSCVLLDLSKNLSPVLTVSSGCALFALQAFIGGEGSLFRLTKALRAAIILIIIMVTVCFLLSNFAGVSLGRADHIFRIDDSWGTKRGFLWRFSLLTFREYATPLQKLFGAGMNSSPYFVWDFHPEIIGPMFFTPHNFILQWLLEGGLIGLCLFCLFCFFSMKDALKRGGCRALALCGVAVILSGWLVTVPSPDITPFFIVFLAVCSAPSQKTEEPEALSR